LWRGLQHSFHGILEDTSVIGFGGGQALLRQFALGNIFGNSGDPIYICVRIPMGNARS